MNIQELIQQNPNVNFTITGQDLLVSFKHIIQETAEAVLQSSDEKLYTASEVEEKFDICAATRWRWSKLGILQSKKVGNRVYYPESNVKELFNQKIELNDE